MAAAAARVDLKKEFPTVKFSVTSASGAGTSSVRVEWTDGPTSSQVDAVVGKYQYGHFDGMTDCYEYSNSREDLPQAKFVFTVREISPEMKLKFAQNVSETYGGIMPTKLEHLENSHGVKCFADYWSWHQLVWRFASKVDLTDCVDVRHVDDSDIIVSETFVGVKA